MKWRRVRIWACLLDDQSAAMSCSTVDRILQLNQEADREYLLGKLRLEINQVVSPERVEAAVGFLCEKLAGDEWLTVYPGGEVHPGGYIGLKTGPKSSQGLDFLTGVVPLGLALIALCKLKGFDDLIHRLQLNPPERISAMFEALCAAKYRVAGNEVELGPTTEAGKKCDFAVRLNGERIYFECKKENAHGGTYEKFSQYVNKLFAAVREPVRANLGTT